MSDIVASLTSIMKRATGAPGAVSGLQRLSGGANMESSSFVFDGQAYVLRRAPSSEMMEGRAFNHRVEAALVRAAKAAGVTAPEVVAELFPEDAIGTGYVMRKVEAEVSPALICAAPPAALITDIARELARIHAIAPRDELALPTFETAHTLETLKERFLAYGGDRPILALALRWLESNVPSPVAPRLVHGDFRMGNLMVDEDGLAAVLDWELAHWGDPHEDLAYGCMTVWRFGQIEKPAFGVGDLETYFAAYEAESGNMVDRARFRFWLIYRTFWWALGCMQMADIWRTRVDRTLERVVIGRRTSENELDLLMLLEEEAPETQRLPLTPEAPPEPRRKGEPSTAEMLEALREWVASDVKPRAQGREKFMAAVAMNALGMLAREASNPVTVHDAILAADILAGRRDLGSPGLLAKLRRLAIAKLENDSPKYAALEKARSLWLLQR